MSVCLCVCVCVCVHDNSKPKGSIYMELEHIAVYENSSEEFDIGHRSVNNIQDLLISSRMNDLTNC